MGIAKFYKMTEIEIVRQARENLEKNRDIETNALGEKDLIDEVERLAPFNPVTARRRNAERMVKDQERPRKTPPEGQYFFPGFDPAPWEPDQLMPDGAGNTVERHKATPYFTAASVERKGRHAQKVVRAFQRELALSDAFTEWATDQRLSGRPKNETTLGNFIREKGYWSATPLMDDEDE